jgi:hypothetical protein
LLGLILEVFEKGIAGSEIHIAFGSSDDEFYPVYQVAQELQVSVHELAEQALKAQLACEEFCQLEVIHW